jgi:hypothetical protein
MRWCLHIVFALTAALLTTACAGDMYDNSANEPIKISLDKLTVDLNEQTVTMGVTARDGAWNMTGEQPWCTVAPSSGSQGVTLVTVSFTTYEAAEDAPPRTATFTFSSGGNTKTITVEQRPTYFTPPRNADYEVNEAIHGALKEWYYNNDPQTTVADFNQRYNKFYLNYLSHLPLNTLDRNSWAEDNDPVIHSYVERNPVGTATSATAPLNYGMEFDLHVFNQRLVGRVLYVEPNSPAEQAGLQRGNWFYKVNNNQLGKWETDFGDFRYSYNRFIDTLVHPISTESPRLSMLSFRPSDQSLYDEGRVVTLTPVNFKTSPIYASQIFNVNRITALGGGERKVGYLMYNSFDPAYRTELETLFRDTFLPAELNDFVLDLRYNKTGTVAMAELMGNLLAGNAPDVAGKVFAKYTSRGGAQAATLDRTALFAAHADGIALDRLFILTSRHTAGAAELLINALRGLDQQKVKLVVVGETTLGLAAGMVKRTHTPTDGEWEYSAWMVSHGVQNDTGQGNYMYGLVPNGPTVDEWRGRENLQWSASWGWKTNDVSDSSQDQMLLQAVLMIRGSQNIPSGSVSNAPQRQQTGLPREFCFPANMMME